MSRICWRSQSETIRKIYCLSHLSQYLIQCREARIETWHISVPVSRGQPCVAKLKQRDKYESSKVRVYIKNEGIALDVDSSIRHKMPSTDKKEEEEEES